MKIKLLFFCLIVPFILNACSSTQQSTGSTAEKKQTNANGNVAEKKQTNTNKDSLYVFDAVLPNTPKKEVQETQPGEKKDEMNETPSRMSMTYYVVQIGAFTTKEKADEFAAESRNKINYKIIVNFNPEVNLYVVRLLPEYTSHDEAEQVRNSIWRMKEFKDAWISTVRK